MHDPTQALRTARIAATALCLIAVVYAVVLVMGQGAGMPPLVLLGMVLITATPFLAQRALTLVETRLKRGRALPVALLLMLAAMMVVPTLFWGLGFASHLSEALRASATSDLATTAVAIGVGTLVSGVPAALSACLVATFLRLIAHPTRPA